MTTLRRIASVATIAVMAAGTLAVLPAAHAGLTEAEPTEPPTAYTINGVEFPEGCVLQRLDLGSAAVTPLGAAPSREACVIDLAVAPDGSVWGIGPVPFEGVPGPAFLTRFDPATGEVLSSTLFTGDFSEALGIFGGLAFDGAGTLYAQLVTDEPGCDDDFVCLYTVDPSTAVATFVGAPGADFGRTTLVFLAADCGASMLTIDPVADEAVPAPTSWGDPAVTGHEDTESLASYDKPSGALSTVAHLADPDHFVVGLDYSRADGTLYALLAPRQIRGDAGEASTDSTTATTVTAETSDGIYASAFEVSLYTVDPATAAVTLVAPSDPEANIVTIGIAGECPVPAPPPIVLEPTFTG